MSKVVNYMITSVGLLILLRLSGIINGSTSLLSWIGLDTLTIGGFATSSFVNSVSLIFGAGILATVVIGFFTTTKSESFIVGTFAGGILTAMTSTIITIVNLASSYGYVYYLVLMIFAPLWVGFLISLVNYWRGSDG